MPATCNCALTKSWRLSQLLHSLRRNEDIADLWCCLLLSYRGSVEAMLVSSSVIVLRSFESFTGASLGMFWTKGQHLCLGDTLSTAQQPPEQQRATRWRDIAILRLPKIQKTTHLSSMVICVEEVILAVIGSQFPSVVSHWAVTKSGQNQNVKAEKQIATILSNLRLIRPRRVKRKTFLARPKELTIQFRIRFVRILVSNFRDNDCTLNKFIFRSNSKISWQLKPTR